MKRLFNSTSSLIKPKITFIGGGKMTTAMVSNIIESKLYKPEQIIVSDYNKKKCDFFQQKWNIKTISDNYEASYNSDIIVLAIKPQSIEKIFKNLQNISNKLILSVIAGIPLKTYQDNLKNINKIVRIMPNTPCMIKEGMSVWCSTNLDENDKEIVELLLKSFGKEMYVSNERYIDIATAISGTGPTYLYLLAESMIDSGIHLGLSREQTRELVYQTILGSTKYMIQSEKHPAILRNDITSPGGTSASALYVLEKNGFRGIMSDSIWAAYEKSLELGKK